MKKAFCIVVVLSLLGNIILIQYVFFSRNKPTTANSAQVSSQYPLLSKRLFAESQNDVLVNFVELRDQLREYHETTNQPFGIYFEYLPSGVSIGIDEKENYVVASLLKVPLVMGVYKRIEQNEIKKDDVHTLVKDDLDPSFGNLWQEGAGTQLTIEELVNHTLIDSDNTAARALFRVSTEHRPEEVFDYLDIPKELDNDNPVVNPKNYSSVLRSLYLSSYLTRESSSEILDTLTRTKFSDKLPAPIPSDIKVAHKIGVHLGGDNKQSIYTDCGIVYVPQRPYILCVMTRSDEKTATKYISDVSKIVYDYVSNKKITPSHEAPTP